MNTYVHPKSGEQIRGMRLAPGAILQKSDRYDSSDGRWETCLSVGRTVAKGKHIQWIRPNAELSQAGKIILVFLSKTSSFLTYRLHWKAIPNHGALYDDQIDWKISYQECVQDLIDFGLLEAIHACEVDHGRSYDSNGIFHIPKENEIFRVSDAGHALVRTFEN